MDELLCKRQAQQWRCFVYITFLTYVLRRKQPIYAPKNFELTMYFLLGYFCIHGL